MLSALLCGSSDGNGQTILEVLNLRAAPSAVANESMSGDAQSVSPSQASEVSPCRASRHCRALRAETSRSAWTQVATVFGLALVVRLLHFYLMRDAAIYQVFISDAWSYDNWAQQIAGGEWLGQELYYQTPLYPYSIAVLYAVFGHTAWAVRIFQALLSAAACSLTARSGTRLFTPREGWLAGLLLAFYPPAIFFDGIVQKAAFDLFLMTLLIWVVVQAQPKPRAWHLLLAGLLLAAFALNRENALVLIPLVLVWAVWLAWSEPILVRAKNAVLVLLGIAALLLPVGFRNWYVGGAFLITTSQLGANFWMGNHLAQAAGPSR